MFAQNLKVIYWVTCTSKIQSLKSFFMETKLSLCYCVVVVWSLIKCCCFCWYESTESDYFVCNELFFQIDCHFFALHYLLTNINLELCLHENDFWTQYLAWKFTSNIQVLVNYSICTSQSFLKQQIKYNNIDLKSCRRCLLNSVYTYNDIKNVFSRLEN